MARIIETAPAERRSVDVDAVTVDLIENALRNARYEMDEVLFRTALSPGIREQHDEFPLIADPRGRMVVGQFGLSVPDFLENFDGDIREGDVLLTSDPYSCGAAISHANDWLVVLPIFHGGRLVGWASMFGHMSDVGGKTPSSMPTDARTIFEEGVVIPPIKIYDGGVLDETALRIILNQVRMPQWNRADLNGLIAACRTAARRVEEMCDRFGTDVYLSTLDALLGRNLEAMRVLLGAVFKEGETLSFSEFVLERRLALARRMLLDLRNDNRTISTIALDVGFADLSYFNRSFRSRFGATPSEVRTEGSRRVLPQDQARAADPPPPPHGEPSSEVTVHMAVYRRRPDVNAIVHSEPVFSNVWGVVGEPVTGTLVNMVIYTKGDVPVMPFALSNRTEFGDAMCDVMGDRNAVIWANHGLLTVGDNLRDAFKTSIAVESAAKVLAYARAITDDPIVLDYESLGITASL